MAKNNFSMYATRNDLITVLNDLMSKNDYIFSCIDNDQTLCTFESADKITDLGVTPVGDQNQAKVYLLINRRDNPNLRTVELRGGSMKVIYDQMSHPDSIVFRAGGRVNDLSCIIPSQIGTISDKVWSIALYKDLLSLVKKRFTKIKSYYVGAEAMEKLDQGYRLTTNIKSPVEYDLKR